MGLGLLLIPAISTTGRRGLAMAMTLRAKSTPQFSNIYGFTSFAQLKQHLKLSRNFATVSSTLNPPDLPRLAETARISLTQTEVEEFTPKIQQVVDWFGQLQDVDLQSIEPAIRADTEGINWRDDLPETFENREAMVAAVPNFEDPYIVVPKVLNKE